MKRGIKIKVSHTNSTQPETKQNNLYKIGVVWCYFEPLAGPIVMVGVSLASSRPPDDHLIGRTPPRCPLAAPAPSGGSGASGPPRKQI